MEWRKEVLLACVLIWVWKKFSTCLTSVSLAKHGLLSCIVNVQDLVENKRGKWKDLNMKNKKQTILPNKK